MLSKCDRDESCTGKLALISPKGPKFVYIDEEFGINGIQPRKIIEGYLDLIPTLTFNTIKTKLIIQAFHSSSK